MKFKKDKYVKEKIFSQDGVEVSSLLRLGKAVEIEDKGAYVSDLTDIVVWTNGLAEFDTCEVVCLLGPLKGEYSITESMAKQTIKEVADILSDILPGIKSKEIDLAIGSYFVLPSGRVIYISKGHAVIFKDDLQNNINQIPVRNINFKNLTTFREEENRLYPAKMAMFVPAWDDDSLIFAKQSKMPN